MKPKPAISSNSRFDRQAITQFFQIIAPSPLKRRRLGKLNERIWPEPALTQARPCSMRRRFSACRVVVARAGSRMSPLRRNNHHRLRPAANAQPATYNIGFHTAPDTDDPEPKRRKIQE